MAFRIALDTVDDDGLEELEAFCHGHSIAMTLVRKDGDAGWPEYEYVAATRAALVRLLNGPFNDGSGDMSYMEQMITEVTAQ